jgi:hypothetical protein
VSAPTGPWLPEGTEEFGPPGSFNKAFQEWMDGQPARDAELARIIAANDAAARKRETVKEQDAFLFWA